MPDEQVWACGSTLGAPPFDMTADASSSGDGGGSDDSSSGFHALRIGWAPNAPSLSWYASSSTSAAGSSTDFSEAAVVFQWG